MAVVYSPNVIEIAVVQTQASRPVVNVWHMHWQAEWSGENIADLVEDFRDNWQTHITPNQASALVLNEFRYRSLSAGNGTVGVMDPDPGNNTQGQRSAAAASVNTAWLVEKRTNNRPRGRRDGRCYLAGVTEESIDAGGNLTSQYLTDLNGSLQSFLDGISDAGWNAAGDKYPVVLETTPASRAPGTQSVTIGSRRITALVLDPVAGTQRDRMR